MTILVNTSKNGCVKVNKREDEINKIIEKAVRDGDGGLNKEELKKAFRDLGSHVPRWRAYRALRLADTNDDGVIAGDDEVNKIIKYAITKYAFK